MSEQILNDRKIAVLETRGLSSLRDALESELRFEP